MTLYNPLTKSVSGSVIFDVRFTNSVGELYVRQFRQSVDIPAQSSNTVIVHSGEMGDGYHASVALKSCDNKQARQVNSPDIDIDVIGISTKFNAKTKREAIYVKFKSIKNGTVVEVATEGGDLTQSDIDDMKAAVRSRM